LFLEYQKWKEKTMNAKAFYKRLFLGIIVIVLVFPLASCAPPEAAEIVEEEQEVEPPAESTEAEEADPTAAPEEPLTVIESDQERVAYSEEVDVSPVVEGNTAFAVDLYQTLKEDRDNLFYSPYSISLALAMTYAGAEGETAQQMADVMHFPAPEAQMHAEFNALDQKLTNLGEDQEIPEGMGDAFQLNIANALWGQQDFSFMPAFLDTLSRHYGAGLNTVDFKQNPEGSRKTINQWVSDETEEKIRDLIPQGGVTADTRLVLTNAIYFQAGWTTPFAEEETREESFYLLDGEEIQVPMMGYDKTERFPYLKGENYQVVEMPYLGNQTSMLVIVPDQGAFESVEENLTAGQVSEIRQNLKSESLQLRFPKFEFRTKFNLTQSLAGMGMTLPVSREADFSGMTEETELYISNVFHQAFVAVDEEGTEAAAASAVAMDVTSVGAEPIELTVDRPFLFFIQERETGAILFMGRVVNPGK
jgi:serpin B